MKKLTIFLSACILLFSCQKDETTPANGQENVPQGKSLVTFSVADFIRKLENFPAARKADASVNARDTTLHNKIGHIYYRIYDNATQALVRSLDQSYAADSATFGIYSDTLEYGSYTLVATASPDSLMLNNSSTLNNLTLLGKYSGSNLAPWPEIFAKKYSFQVGTATDVTDLELDRIIGKLEVRLSDATYPLYRIDITATSESDQFNLGTWLPGAATAPLTIHRVNDTTFSNYFMNTATPVSVSITVTNVYTGIVVNKVIDNVRCYTNRRTIISGKIVSFDPNLPFGIPILGIKVDDNWETGGPVYNY